MRRAPHAGQQAAVPVARRRLFLLAVLACAWASAAQAQEVRRFDLALKGGELPKAERTIKVKEGDTVELRWTSDQPVRLHLHGYDIEVAVTPGAPAVMAFKGRLAGRFSVDRVQEQKKPGAHQHGGKVLFFEVHP
jgi:FtsP/CotA-like multicopper oxidase with cupredoxin domain